MLHTTGGFNMSIVISFCVFLLLFAAVGLWASKHKTKTTEDYLVAGRSVSPWLTALSAFSTGNSGFWFVAFMGLAYRHGLSSVTFAVSFFIGNWSTWYWAHHRIRKQSEDIKATSATHFIGTDRHGNVSRIITLITGVITFVFLSIYAAAQLKVGAIATENIFDWPLWIGCTLGALLIILYCFSGGIRASIWTDAVQSIVMLGSLALLVFVAWFHVGDPITLVNKLTQIDPQLVTLTPNDATWGFAMYFIGYVFGGIGTIGQPHIFVRFIALNSPDSVARTRNIYLIYFFSFIVVAMFVGLYGRVLLPDLGLGLSGDALKNATEQVLPKLSSQLLPGILTGVILAGIFAATISTADSQVLACSAIVTQDVFPVWKHSYLASKITTVVVLILSLVIAIAAPGSVFGIILLAWSSIAATITPILIVRLFKLPLPTWLALVMIASGFGIVLYWELLTAYNDAMYSALPGIALPGIIYAIAYLTGFAKPTSSPR